VRLTELKEYVWRRLGVRKFLVGRERVSELVEIAVANWDHDAMKNAKGKKELEVVAQGMALGIKRTDEMLGGHGYEKEYGVLWAILLQALVGAIVQILIKWWLESAKNKVTLWALKKDLVG